MEKKIVNTNAVLWCGIHQRELFECDDPKCYGKHDTTNIPIELGTIDIEPLRQICAGYLELINKGEEMKDGRHYIYEVAMETFYGKEVWKFINSKI